MHYYIYLNSSSEIVSDSAELIPDKAGYTVISFEERQSGKWDSSTLSFIAWPERRVLPLRDFIDRFTDLERDDLFEVAKTVKKAKTFIEIMKIYGEADLDSNFIITHVNLMESAGVLGSGRADEILA